MTQQANDSLSHSAVAATASAAFRSAASPSAASSSSSAATTVAPSAETLAQLVDAIVADTQSYDALFEKVGAALALERPAADEQNPLTDARNALHAARTALRSTVYRVVFLGTPGVGKSEAINCLCRHNVLPSRATAEPVTEVPCDVRAAPCEQTKGGAAGSGLVFSVRAERDTTRQRLLGPRKPRAADEAPERDAAQQQQQHPRASEQDAARAAALETTRAFDTAAECSAYVRRLMRECVSDDTEYWRVAVTVPAGSLPAEVVLVDLPGSQNFAQFALDIRHAAQVVHVSARIPQHDTVRAMMRAIFADDGFTENDAATNVLPALAFLFFDGEEAASAPANDAAASKRLASCLAVVRDTVEQCASQALDKPTKNVRSQSVASMARERTARRLVQLTSVAFREAILDSARVVEARARLLDDADKVARETACRDALASMAQFNVVLRAMCMTPSQAKKNARHAQHSLAHSLADLHMTDDEYTWASEVVSYTWLTTTTLSDTHSSAFVKRRLTLQSGDLAREYVQRIIAAVRVVLEKTMVAIVSDATAVARAAERRRARDLDESAQLRRDGDGEETAATANAMDTATALRMRASELLGTIETFVGAALQERLGDVLLHAESERQSADLARDAMSWAVDLTRTKLRALIDQLIRAFIVPSVMLPALSPVAEQARAWSVTQTQKLRAWTQRAFPIPVQRVDFEDDLPLRTTNDGPPASYPLRNAGACFREVVLQLSKEARRSWAAKRSTDESETDAAHQSQHESDERSGPARNPRSADAEQSDAKRVAPQPRA